MGLLIYIGIGLLCVLIFGVRNFTEWCTVVIAWPFIFFVVIIAFIAGWVDAERDNKRNR